MIIDCISDLHGHYPKLDGGDLLIVAGDLTARDTDDQYWKFNTWLKEQKYKKIIVVAGNHDNRLVQTKNLHMAHAYCHPGEYLLDSGTEFEGLKIWGSPWTKTFEGMNPHCKAFTVDTDGELSEKWAMIPYDIDILVTHSPPLSILDGIPRDDESLYHAGSLSLYLWLDYWGRPKIHVFGHIHEGYGRAEVFGTEGGEMMVSVNASHVNETYEPVNKPIRIILD